MSFHILKDRSILSLLGLVLAAGVSVSAQTPTPTPSDDTDEGYKVTSTIELGVRGMSVNGADNKYRSDLNYRPGFRVFDSSFLVENKEGKIFDSALITSTGWGGDPSGMFRFNMEKTGIYRFDSNLRRVKYFNSLNNHALGQHGANTDHNFGDLDVTIFPERDLRFRFGYSFNRTDGPAGFTTRAYSDEFGVQSDVDNGSDDLRLGADAKLWGFNLGFTYGHRKFSERTRYFIDGLNLGNNPTNNPRLFTFERLYPIDGRTDFGQFHVQRTFAEKVDFTARFLYSVTSSDFSVDERMTGRDNSNNTVDLDQFTIFGDTKRPQARGDLGLTYRVTSKFRIGNTFTYDQFSINGGNDFFEELRRRNAAGTVLPTVFTSTFAHRVTGYKRATNLLEGDYQVNRRFGFNIGYRYTHRSVDLDGRDINRINNSLTGFTDTFKNSTHGVIAGFTAKPLNNWTVYGDIERGKADNVFTRLANYDFTNFRLRTRASFDKVGFSASFISRSNDNPSRSIEIPPRDFTAETRSKTFTTSVDWAPIPELSLATGYTYQHLTAETNIIVPVAGQRREGISEFYIRDSYFFFDVHATPIKRVSLFASYRINDDRGQGDRVSLLPENIITSYPMQMQSPEVRLAIRLHRMVDWNLGYQYYNYKERFVNAQNYNAHLPYTSLRFYFGRSADR